MMGDYGEAFFTFALTIEQDAISIVKQIVKNVYSNVIMMAAASSSLEALSVTVSLRI